MTEEVTLTPTKETYDAIKADVDECAAVKELADNGIDNARRQGHTRVTLGIRYLPGDASSPEEFVVEDDSGGLKKDEMAMVFALGRSEKDDVTGSIGAFGIGAKKALMRLGGRFEVISRHEDAETGWKYTIDEEWLNDDDEWTAELEAVDIDPGTTVLRIQNLNFRWSGVRDRLREELRETYALFLRGRAGVELTIQFEDRRRDISEVLSSPRRPEYSYTPWDGLFPRRFEGIVLDPPETDSPVVMDVTAGLLTEGDKEQAGTDLLCQNRVVERANREKAGGYGAPEGLDEFKLSKHKRLKLRVEFRTNGDAAELPWNSDKSRLHPHHPVMQEAYGWIRKIGERYMDAKYGTAAPAFFEPYAKESRYAANSGRMYAVDLKPKFDRLRRGDLEQVQITEKPSKKLPEVKRMDATVTAHTMLGIKYEYMGWVKPWMRPTYNALYESEFSSVDCFDEAVVLDQSPPDFTTDGRNVENEIRRLQQLAEDHASVGVRYTEMETWEQPRYEYHLRQAAEDYEALVPTDERPDVEQEKEEQGVEETTELTIAPFTESELAIISRHLGDFEAYTPEERKNVLLEHFRRLNSAGLAFEVSAD